MPSFFASVSLVAWVLAAIEICLPAPLSPWKYAQTTPIDMALFSVGFLTTALFICGSGRGKRRADVGTSAAEIQERLRRRVEQLERVAADRHKQLEAAEAAKRETETELEERAGELKTELEREKTRAKEMVSLAEGRREALADRIDWAETVHENWRGLEEARRQAQAAMDGEVGEQRRRAEVAELRLEFASDKIAALEREIAGVAPLVGGLREQLRRLEDRSKASEARLEGVGAERDMLASVARHLREHRREAEYVRRRELDPLLERAHVAETQRTKALARIDGLEARHAEERGQWQQRFERQMQQLSSLRMETVLRRGRARGDAQEASGTKESDSEDPPGDLKPLDEVERAAASDGEWEDVEGWEGWQGDEREWEVVDEEAE